MAPAARLFLRNCGGVALLGRLNRYDPSRQGEFSLAGGDSGVHEGELRRLGLPVRVAHFGVIHHS
jgi:hypothetical protein